MNVKNGFRVFGGKYLGIVSLYNSGRKGEIKVFIGKKFLWMWVAVNESRVSKMKFPVGDFLPMEHAVKFGIFPSRIMETKFLAESFGYEYSQAIGNCPKIIISKEANKENKPMLAMDLSRIEPLGMARLFSLEKKDLLQGAINQFESRIRRRVFRLPEDCR